MPEFRLKLRTVSQKDYSLTGLFICLFVGMLWTSIIMQKTAFMNAYIGLAKKHSYEPDY